MSAQIRCPHCSALLALLRPDLSKSITCPRCKQQFQATITPSLSSLSRSAGPSRGLTVALVLLTVVGVAVGAGAGFGYFWWLKQENAGALMAAKTEPTPAERIASPDKPVAQPERPHGSPTTPRPEEPIANPEPPKPQEAGRKPDNPAPSNPVPPAEPPPASPPPMPPQPPAPEQREEEEKPQPPPPPRDEPPPAPQPPKPPASSEQPRVAESKDPEPRTNVSTLTASPNRGPIRSFKRIREVPESQVRAELIKVPDLLINPEWIRQFSRTGISPLLRRFGADEEVDKDLLEKETSPLKTPPYVISSSTQFRRHLPGLKGEVESLFAPDEAKDMDVLSRKLRETLAKASNQNADPLTSRFGLFGNVGDNRLNIDRFRQEIQRQRHEWYRPEAVSTLYQILEPETKDLRLLLVEMMRDIPCQKSTEGLVRLAIFDISPQVREAAIEALKTLPIESYRQKLLDGLMYPWLPAAEHAAEALVALDDRKAIPHLIALLENPKDPRMIYPQDRTDKPSYVQNLVPLQSFRGEPLRAELVKINHLANCMLCHKPTDNPDGTLVSRAPIPGRPLPRGFDVRSPAYYAFGEALVRADVTRLRQDFSVTLTVPDAGAWPGQQRFDYLIMLRPATPKEREEFAKLTEPPLHHGPVLFALRELTGCDLGPDPRCWAMFKRETEN